MERENVLNYLSAFAVGSIAGAALALLYAPQRGDETRQIVRDGIRRGAERSREKIRQGAELSREKIRQGAELTREKLHQGAEYGRHMAQRVTGRAEEMVDAAAPYVEAAGEVSPFGERRRKPRTLSSEMPEQV